MLILHWFITVITSDKNKENKFVVDNIDDLLKGLFKIVETDNSNAKAACLCLVNISATENGLNKIMSFIDSDMSSNNSVYFIKYHTILGIDTQ